MQETESTPRRVDWRFAALVAAILAVLFGIQQWINVDSLSFGVALARQTVVWGVWLGLSPFIFWYARKHPFGGEESGRAWLVRQAFAGGVFAIAHSVIASVIRFTIGIAVASTLADAIVTSLASNIGANYLRYSAIALAYQAVAYHQTVRERDAQAARMRVDLAEAKLATLEGRLRPHFLFNTLNSIAALIREDPGAAEAMVGQLSDLLRASLNADPLREVTLADELALVEQYLAIQRARFQDRLGSSIHATQAARSALVPHLILQPLVENAVRHGIAPREAGGNVWVFADQIGDRLVVTVEDDGVGIGNAPLEAAGHGVGLGGTRSRLEHLYGTDLAIDVSARRPAGTQVRIEIPYRTSTVVRRTEGSTV
jgi:two-component system LytT family sensor kinase